MMTITRGVDAIARSVFEAKHSADPRYETEDWRILIGSAARLHLQAEAPKEPMIVGRHFYPPSPDGHLTERGYVDHLTVLGVPVVEDPRGPLWQWRLTDGEGLTIAWGEWPNPDAVDPHP
jgi:hypothetical protein